MEGSCGQKPGAARECCCSCERDSRRQVLEGGGGPTTGAEITKSDQRNAAAQDGISAQGVGQYNIYDAKIQQTRMTKQKCSKNLELRLELPLIVDVLV